MGAFEVRRNLGILIEEAYYKKESVIIKNHGRPMAAIISIEDYERMRQLAKGQVFTLLQSVWDENKEIPTEQLEREVKRALTILHKERKVLHSQRQVKKG